MPGDNEDALFPEGNNNGSGGDYHEGSKEDNIDEVDSGVLSMIRKNIETANVKMPSINPKDGLFDLVFTPRSSGNDVEIELFIIGTGSNDVIPVNVLKAKNGMFHLKTKKNKVFMKRIERGTKYKINLKLDVKQNYIWEVNISANE